MQLHFVRHGQTDANAKGVHLSSADFLDGPLNQRGVGQAQRLAEELKDIRFDAIISSPLKRAYQTAEIISTFHGLPVKIDDSWRERDAEVYADKSMWDELFDFDKNIPVKNGENITDFFERVYTAIDTVKSEYGSQTILIVSHGGVQHAVYAYSNKLPWSGNTRIKPIGNGECRVFEL